jgi:tetratricopeptide (TPR) repeat protein
MSTGTNNRDLKKLYDESLSHYERKEYDKALTKIDKILKADKNNIHARNVKASILIESWDGTIETKRQILEAIDHLNMAMKNDPENKMIYLKNKGNAFYKLAISALKESFDKLNTKIINNLEQAKSCFHKSLEITENQPEVWINKGNSLDYLGRYLEAIECYDKAILLDNKHYNTWGNRGISCWRLSKLTEHEGDHAKKLFLDAMIYLAIELEMYPDFEIEDTKKEFLFLNIHFDCNKCECSTLDLIRVGFLTSINDSKKPYELFKKWFALVDDYKTSRSLLALSQFRPKEAFLIKPIF